MSAMNERLVKLLASAIPVDPDDGTLPVDYRKIDDPDEPLIRNWGSPESVAEEQVVALRAAGIYVLTPDSDDVAALARALGEAHWEDGAPMILLASSHLLNVSRQAIAALTEGGAS